MDRLFAIVARTACAKLEDLGEWPLDSDARLQNAGEIADENRRAESFDLPRVIAPIETTHATYRAARHQTAFIRLIRAIGTQFDCALDVERFALATLEITVA
jgi:hypothetical protein